MKPRRELFSSSSLASSHPASAGRPKGEIANAISSPAIPVGMSFSTNSIRTLSSPSTDARMESKPAERLSRNESTATSRVSTSTKGAARILNMIRIGGSSFFLYMSIITLKKSALKDVSALRTSGHDDQRCGQPGNGAGPFPLCQIVTMAESWASRSDNGPHRAA